MPAPRIEAVFFDVGGTILRVEPSVGAVYAATAKEHGFEIAADLIEREFRAAWKQSLERGRARGFRSSDEILRGEWFEIVRDTFKNLVPASRLPALFVDLYERFASAQAWRLVPGIRATLRYLRGEGVRLGVLSNWDSRLQRMLLELDLESSFDVMVISHDVGYEKPHAAIFEDALRLSGSAPSRTLHVGDSFEADIKPARALGIQTLWVAPRWERETEEDAGPGVDHLPEEPLPFWGSTLHGTQANISLK